MVVVVLGLKGWGYFLTGEGEGRVTFGIAQSAISSLFLRLVPLGLGVKLFL